MGVKKIFYKLYWIELKYNLVQGFKNFKKWYKIIWKIRPYHPEDGLLLLSEHIKSLIKSKEKDYEVEKDKQEKLALMQEVVFLIDNILEDNYVKRCGGLNSSKYPFEFEKIENSDYFKLVEFRTKEEREKDSETIKKSIQLQEKEWDKVFQILKGSEKTPGLNCWWS